MNLWLPRNEILSFLLEVDGEWKNFSEILAKVGPSIMMERATRLYQSSGAGRVKDENGKNVRISFDEMQKKWELSAMVHKGRRRGIAMAIQTMLNNELVECKDLGAKVDFREYRILKGGKDWLIEDAKPKPEKLKKEPKRRKITASSDAPTPTPDDTGTKKREKADLADLSVLDFVRLLAKTKEVLKHSSAFKCDEPALGPEPKMQLHIPKDIQELLNWVDQLEVDIPRAFNNIKQVLPPEDQHAISSSLRDVKRRLQYNVFAPVPIPPAPALPASPAPLSCPAGENNGGVE